MIKTEQYQVRLTKQQKVEMELLKGSKKANKEKFTLPKLIRETIQNYIEEKV